MTTYTDEYVAYLREYIEHLRRRLEEVLATQEPARKTVYIYKDQSPDEFYNNANIPVCAAFYKHADAIYGAAYSLNRVGSILKADPSATVRSNEYAITITCLAKLADKLLNAGLVEERNDDYDF